jgi:hypothetical protein
VGGSGITAERSDTPGNTGPGTPVRAEGDDRTPDRRWAHPWRAGLLAAGSYLIVSVGLWWHVWASDPRSTTVCGCGDSSFTLWFVEFAAHALRTGSSPLVTTLLWYPHGINVLDQASQLGLGLPLAPLTWVGGAVLSMNVALTLAPAASALTVYVLLDRWGVWRPAAFVGGLVYGFSPLVVMNLAEAHLVVGFVAAPPLIVLCLDQLLLRDPRRPVLVGVALGMLAAFQFFVSSEVLLITALACALGVAAVLLHGSLVRTGDRPTTAWTGLTAGGATAAVLLGYPVWFALAGPSHVSGAIYPGGGVASSGAAIRGFLLPTPVMVPFTRYLERIGGYQGPHLSTGYFGIGLVGVLLGGLLAFRRDRRLWLSAGIGTWSAVLALGSSPSGWRPWDVVDHLPLLQNVVPVRMLLITWLCAGIALAVVADHVRRVLPLAWGRCRTARVLSDAVTVALLSVAVVPIAAYLSQTAPLTTRPVVLPLWFQRVAPRLPQHQVLLVVPVPFSAIQSALTWQSQNHLSFAMAGGDGPGSQPGGGGGHPEAQQLLAGVSGAFDPPPVTPAGIASVRVALADWRVTEVVEPDQLELPGYDQPFAPVAAAALVTAALGRAPRHQARAWVWSVSADQPAPVSVTAASFARCTASSGGAALGIAAASACVLGGTGGTEQTRLLP